MRAAALLRRWKPEGIRPAAPLQAFIHRPSAPASRRHLNIFSVFSKEARQKERERLKDEMTRGYFDDMKDLTKHGGKIALASCNLRPRAISQTFPELLVQNALGDTLTIPSQVQSVEENKTPRVTLVCIAFRASGQNMVESWSIPFHDAFKLTPGVLLYEVSWIESWFLSIPPFQSLLLRSMRKEVRDSDQLTRRQVVYAFGDSYEIRKALNIQNRLSGYVLLLDEEGYIRWQGSGMATAEELRFMVACTSLLLKQQQLCPA